MNFKISIVTVCFNDLESLVVTSKSVGSQMLPGVEWIVVDGGSTDNTVKYLEGNREISQYVSEPDLGIYDAMNKGTALASGDFVIYLNAGDVFCSESTLVQLAQSNVVADVVFLGACFTYKKKSSRYRAPRNVSSVWHSVPANHQATVYRREVLGAKPYDITYKICGDYDLIARLCARNVTTQVIDMPFVSFELGGVSTFEIGALATEALRVQREVLNLPLYIRQVSWIRRFVSMYANLLLCVINGIKK